MQQETVLDRPEIGATVRALRSGEVFATISLDDAAERAAALEAVLQDVADDGTAVTWVGNPLRSALTIERFLLQIIGPEIDLRIERDAAELAELLGRRTGDGRRRLVVVQQPETIDPETRDRLEAMAAHLTGPDRPTQFLFAASSAFRPISVGARLVARTVPAPGGTQAVATGDAPGRVRRGVEALPIVFLLSLAATAYYVGSSREGPHSAPVRPTPEASESSVPTSALAPAEPLRQRFDEFLQERAAELPPLSAAQKDELFNEFLARKRGP